ncbi:MAG: HAD-IA family hydrolase [Acidobacteriota bacterium]
MPCLAEGLALVFDLDGVIVDSNAMHVLAWRQYLESCGLGLPADYHPLIFGRRNDDIVSDLYGHGLSGAAAAAHGAAKEAVYRELMRPALSEHLVPGVRAFLERHRGAPIGLASNAERANIDLVLDSAGLRAYFRAVIDGHEVMRPKPDPEIYLGIAASLSVAPANCIVFEDSHTGVAAARAAGARVVGVQTTHAELAGVDLSIRDFHAPELGQWLRAQQPSV